MPRSINPLLPLITQGTHYCTTLDAPDRVKQPEHITVAELYADGRMKQDAPIVIHRIVAGAHRSAVANGGLNQGAATTLAQLCGKGKQYATAHAVMAGLHSLAGGSASEECERELEKEEEEEEEVEREVAKVSPASELDWEYCTALEATSVSDLDAGARCDSLADAVQQVLVPDSLGSMEWSTQVWLTHNFLHAAALPLGSAGNDYLRHVDAVLLLPSGEIVLLSEREADGVVRAMRQAHAHANPLGPADRWLHHQQPALMHLPYMHHALATGTGRVMLAQAAHPVAAPSCAVLSDASTVAALVSARVFNGDTVYGGLPSDDLEALVRGHKAEVEVLVGARGKSTHLPRSDVERACG